MQRKKSGGSVRRPLLWAIFILYLAWLAKLTVFRYPPALLWQQLISVDAAALRLRLAYGSNLVPLRTIATYLFRAPSLAAARIDLIGNVAFFVPFGLLLSLLRPGRPDRYVVTGAAAFSLLLELAQFATGAGSFDVDDLLLNTVGAGIGCAAYQAAGYLRARGERRGKSKPALRSRG